MNHKQLILALAALTLASAAYAQPGRNKNTTTTEQQTTSQQQTTQQSTGTTGTTGGRRIAVKRGTSTNTTTTETEGSARRGIKNRTTSNSSSSSSTTNTGSRPSTSVSYGTASRSGGSSSQASASQDRAKAINNGFENRYSYDRKDALTKTPVNDGPLPKIIVNTAGEAFILSTTTKNVVDQGGPEMFAADITSIYPGAIIYVNSDLANGKPQLVGLPYGTVDLKIDYNTGGQTTKYGVINDPGKIQTAIYQLLEAKDTYVQPANMNSTSTSYTSISKMAIDLGVDSKFLGATVKVDTKTTSSNSKIVEVQDFTQKYYTISVIPNPDKSTYFGKDVTWDHILNKINQNGCPLGMINSVTYGRRAYVFNEYVTSDFQFKGNQSGSYSGTTVTSAQDITKSSKSSKEWMYMMGGSASSAATVLGGSKIKDALAKEAELKIGPSNQGVPICYTAVFLASGRGITAKATGQYTETGYVKCPKTVRWEIKNTAYAAGDCIKFKAMYNVIYVFPDGKDADGNVKYNFEVVTGKGSGEKRFADYIENKYEKGTKKVRTMPTNDIEKCTTPSGRRVNIDNCYIYGNVYYTIRSQTAKGQDCSEKESGWFDISSGSMYVEMGGSALAGGGGVHTTGKCDPKPMGKK